MYEHNALGYWSGLALCLTKVRSSRARCPATALIVLEIDFTWMRWFSREHYYFILTRCDDTSYRPLNFLSLGV